MLTGWRVWVVTGLLAPGAVLAGGALPSSTRPSKPAAQSAARPGVAAPEPARPVHPSPAVDPVEEVVEVTDARTAGQVCADVRMPAMPLEGAPDIVEQRLAAASQATARRAALERIYAVTIPSDRFTFGDYDTDAGVMSISTTGGFHVMQGALHVWTSETEPLELHMAVPAVQDALAARKTGALSLKAYFHLDADPDDDGPDSLRGEPCASRAGVQAYVMAVTWLGGELWDTRGRRQLASFTTEKGRQTAHLAHMLLGQAQLRIGAPEGAGDGTGAVAAAMEARRAAFQECYAHHGRQAEGGMVLGLDLKAGALERVGVDIASLDSDELGACLSAAVKTSQLAAKGAAGHVTVPLVWSRD
ncbi:MAG: hypothetical protein HY904_15425 [Deltaproteobacteria bacterium]|nr:hypothetical protein [Deltaproteobacteria bacterium]